MLPPEVFFREKEPLPQNLAILIPGQGGEITPQALEPPYRHSRVARETIDSLIFLGYPSLEVCSRWSEEERSQTGRAQPFWIMSAIGWGKWLEEKYPEIKPRFFAGHSLGLVPSLYLAGVLSLEETALLGLERAKLMQKVNEESPGQMCVVLNLPEEVVKKVCEEEGEEIVVANFNSPLQFVVSGAKAVVEKAKIKFQQLKAKLIELPLDVPAHHPGFMAQVSTGLAHFIEAKRINFYDAQVPIISNRSGKPLISGKEIQEEVIQGVSSPVYWQKMVEQMIQAGVKTFVELGPGRRLISLIKRIKPEAGGGKDLALFNTPEFLTSF